MAHLAVHHAEALAPHPEELRRQRIARGVARARRYGLTAEASIAAFVSIMFEVAPSFDEQPAIHALLTDSRIPPSFRISAAVHRASREDWEEAERMSDSRAWEALEQERG